MANLYKGYTPGRIRHVSLNFFFHGRGTALQKTPIGMYRELLHQLYSQASSARSIIRKVIEEKRSLKSADDQLHWQEKELAELFSNAVQLVAKEKRITMFVDALDEAGPEAAKSLVQVFHAMHDRAVEDGSMLRICISCRDYPVVSGYSPFEVEVHKENFNDIKLYVQGQLNQRVAGWAQDEQSIEDKQKVEKKIVRKSSGMFQWIRMVIPMVVDQLNDGESIQMILDHLDQVPSELGNLYKDILTNVVQAPNRSRTLLLMQWVALASRPLTLDELRCAMASDDLYVQPRQMSCNEGKQFVETFSGMKSLVKVLSGGLVEVHHNEPFYTVEFIHQTVNEFLLPGGLKYLLAATTDPERGELFDQLSAASDSMTIGESHHRLSRSCLNYLRLGDIIEEKQQWNTEAEDGLIMKYPFVRYATDGWMFHAEQAERHGISQEGIVMILRNPADYFKKWLEIHSSMTADMDVCRPRPGSTFLHVASYSNLQTVARVLLDEGASVTARDAGYNTVLHCAAKRGHRGLAEMLLREKVPFGVENMSHYTEFDLAAGSGHEDIIRLFLAEGCNINQASKVGTVLHTAANRGNTKLVRMLLDLGADVNVTGGYFGSSLEAAASGSRLEMFRYLLDKGAKVTNVESSLYGNPLQAAAYVGNKEIVETLLQHGASVNMQGGRYGNALQAAAYVNGWNPSVELVRFLIDQGADLNTTSGEYGNALQAAVAASSMDLKRKRHIFPIARLLLDSGLDINLKGGYYGSTLAAAAQSGNLEIVGFLLDNGAQIDMGGRFGCPLAVAAGARHKAMVELLIHRGANINAQDENGETALGHAVSGGDLDIVRFLLRNNANVNLGENDCCPLRISASRGQPEIFHLLLEYGAELSCVNMGVAATGGNVAIMQFCLENGGDVNERDVNNGCALQTAAFMGHTEAVRFLLDHGADPNIRGGQSGNALQAAVRADSVDIVEMLLDAGAEDIEDRIWGSALKTANDSLGGNRMLIIQALQAKSQKLASSN
jgi:ankyrin repeat protein